MTTEDEITAFDERQMARDREFEQEFSKPLFDPVRTSAKRRLPLSPRPTVLMLNVPCFWDGGKKMCLKCADCKSHFS